jgi:DNA-binding response OmpR family regulator
MRVLIVEDEVFVALHLKEELSAAGHEVLGPTAVPAEAQSFVQRGEVDFAILDINLDGRSPRELAEDLRRRGIPFAYVSGYDEAHVRTNMPEAPLVSKPLEMRVLHDLIDRVVGGNKA